MLFVCLGNICRSPMAEGVFRSIAKEPQYKELIGRIDSSGTGRPALLHFPLFASRRRCGKRRGERQRGGALQEGDADAELCGPYAGAYHIGEPPDHRTLLTLETHGIRGYKHAARKVSWSSLDGLLTTSSSSSDIDSLTQIALPFLSGPSLRF